MVLLGCVACLAIPLDDAGRFCGNVFEKVSGAFDKTDLPLPVRSALVIPWRGGFSEDVRKAVLNSVGEDFCLMEITSGGASIIKYGGGSLKDFFVVNRHIIAKSGISLSRTNFLS